jgi:hypothetical protein
MAVFSLKYPLSIRLLYGQKLHPIKSNHFMKSAPEYALSNKQGVLYLFDVIGWVIGGCN